MRSALGGAAVAGLILSMTLATPASATGPSVIADAACSTGTPYGVGVRAEGFAPNDRVQIIVVLYESSGIESFLYGMITDGNGAATLTSGPLAEPEPFRLGLLFFHDLDRSGSYNHSDELIANLLLTIDKPCTGAVAQPK